MGVCRRPPLPRTSRKSDRIGSEFLFSRTHSLPLYKLLEDKTAQRFQILSIGRAAAGRWLNRQAIDTLSSECILSNSEYFKFGMNCRSNYVMHNRAYLAYRDVKQPRRATTSYSYLNINATIKNLVFVCVKLRWVKRDYKLSEIELQAK